MMESDACGDEVRTMFDRERTAHVYLQKQGYKILKRGWPDVLAVHPVTGEVRFIEIKGEFDKLKRPQRLMAEMFDRVGLEYEVMRVRQEDGDFVVIDNLYSGA